MNTFLEPLRPHLLLIGRVLLAAMFIQAGWGKISAYEATQGYMAAMGVPGGLLPLVILAELGGGLAILLGFLTPVAALGLAVFSVIAAVLFHGGDDPAQQIHFMKNLSIAGGLVVLAAAGGGRASIDALMQRNRR